MSEPRDEGAGGETTAPPATADGDVAVRVEDLEKLYRRTTAGHALRTLKSALLERSLIRGLRPEETIPALRGVSFTVPRGQALGLIGSNGSGKSTLLKVMAGILRPNAGRVTIDGRVAALIELGAGFHPEISGRENVYINGAVLGLSRREVDRRFDDIVEFSGLADFIEEPVKNYSSGMYVRLGFSVAVHTDPEVLLVDEVLAVGDESFAHRCLRRIEEFLARGRTLVLVSHSLTLMEEVCDRVLWLEKGRLRLDGHPRRVCDAYREAVAEEEGRAHRQAKEAREAREAQIAAVRPPAPAEEPDTAEDVVPEPAEPVAEAASEPVPEAEPEPEEEVLRWGSREAEIVAVRLVVGDEERYHLRTGDAARFEIDVVAHRPLDDFVFGIAVATPRGTECWGTNTDLAGFAPDELTGAARVMVECPDLRLAPGEYLVDVAVHEHDGTPLDYRRKLLAFSVTSGERGVGIYFPRHRWSFDGAVRWRSTPEG